MPHGDWSDVAALTCVSSGASMVFAPQIWFGQIGPLKPMFEPPMTHGMLHAVRFAGGLLMLLAPVLFVVRWNVLNGKAAALGFTIAAANCVYISLDMDNYEFVLRAWYLFAIFFLITALHMAFNANPMLTSDMLLEKEKAKAEKEKAKANKAM
eukprot:CAMPEP_0115847972 /NCGR_PEP_ID=MMETSP0287-20121206/10670_1 /TAXON_ID=412157 /ORGANISM="Chrysochromulina rotalis, Strain UIO044" /LENGTH=152 /DNA_ID=CAMNT_0003301847 /DNA_START=51 /DNA_END=509 /DNA_ORIENTATION=+